MRYLSLFSGIEACSAAWKPLGWTCVAVAEIEPFPAAVLAHHYPSVPNLGDVTAITDARIAALGPIDLVVGGSPCQDLSVAGKRAGLAGERSSLFHEQVRIFHAARALCGARFLLWENVPGAFSSHGGRDFGIVVGSMAGCELGVPRGGWGTCGAAIGSHGLVEWRVLDAQYVRVESHPRAVPQRRRRVFALLDTGDWRDRPPILLEREGLLGHPAPRREAGQGSPGGSGCGAAISSGRGWWDESNVGACVRAQDSITKADTLVTHSLRAEGFDASEDGMGRGIPLVAGTLKSNGAKSGAENGAEICDRLIPLTVGALTDGAHMGGGLNGQDAYTGRIIPVAGGCVGITGTGRGVPLVPDVTRPLTAAMGTKWNGNGDLESSLIPAIVSQAMSSKWSKGTSGPAGDEVANPIPVGFAQNQRDEVREVSEVPSALRASGGGGDKAHILSAMQVRRLTPLECERLQGFPDDYTLVPVRGKPAADGPRYRALGNSMAVNCMRWIGERVDAAMASQWDAA